MEFTMEEVLEAIETLDGLQPSYYRDILELGPDGTEEYTIHGDDLGSMIHAIHVLKTHFGIVGNTPRTGPLASPNRTVID
ncbi:hypothetical protein SEA_PARADIDDLES_160 [Streptomyces phage Paradiddles]|jgi:hypothetical protein|uniref:Uncharacterized protein n=3 Tax=Samistivirus TaxID=2560220 RepID=A0A514U2A7_9CAUD|nr:hypothetical protein FDI36_gp120 [Streptomyces phage NootNoot]YP_009611126.1 hypothetical protein FDI37_gp119 [Streptomyces phage Paradiddles]YP_010104034.1 hypothetical protein KNU71_gp122 [Streptomyces phage Braelyn]UGL63139.1 hypothetical protein SEA_BARTHOLOMUNE_168 [Streptomyces phage Bartholomune]UOW93572.1 hypothetical protein SEA_SQUILLIUM_169 [Streptomyces phage Squillium]WNM73023.1 hypothetical protein SEA_PERSIMMON_169 [Streptomyces phage Persimmon]WNM73403.1 hypothetical protei